MLVRDPIIELHDTQLYSLLATADQHYAESITRFVSEISPILKTTARHFPYYTRHDSHHGFRVVRRIEQVVVAACLQPDTPNALKPAEIFLLLAAAYAHDLGMTIFPGEEAELRAALGLTSSPGWETDPELQSYLRREHSKRGGMYILQNAERLGIPLNLVNALDTMMKAHNLSIAELDALDPNYAARECLLDVRQLAAIVCVGDALEFSDTRVIEGVLDRIKNENSDSAQVSYRENMKHVCVGDSLAIDRDGRIIVSGTFLEEAVLALAHHTLDQMEEWVRGYCDIDRRSKNRRLKVRPEPFLRNMSIPGVRFERLGIRLNKRSIINLISSNAVWKNNAGIAIRELVQNAVEACRYRVYHSAVSDRYEPAVRVDFDRNTHTIKVSDNGCGMSERTVLNNFLTVGRSRTEEAGYIEADYAPIARFGVGFWSVFAIAAKARIETTAFEDYRGSRTTAVSATGISFEVSLDELKDYTIFRQVHRPCGTQVGLTLREYVVFDDVFAKGQEMLLCSEIPVTFFLDGKELHLPRKIPAVANHEMIGSRVQLFNEIGMKIFRWSGAVGETELSLGLAYRMADGKASFLADGSSPLVLAIGGIRVPRTSVCGFSVQVRLDPMCIDLMRVGTLNANHRTPKGFDFALDRQMLLPNSASERFAQEITELVHDGYREFLTMTNSDDPSTIAALYEQAQMNGGNIYDQFTGTELLNAVERYPRLISFRLFPVRQGSDINVGQPIHVDLETLQGLTGTVFTFQTHVLEKGKGGSVLRSFSPEDPRALRIVYEIIRGWVTSGSVTQPAYVMEANRLGSMLFDADPESSVRFVEYASIGPLCIQAISLERVKFKANPTNILAEVQGKWTGAVYLRSFKTPKEKPYLFLGRHRVLVESSSSLCEYLHELLVSGKRLRLSETIAQLREDDEGYTPEPIRKLV